MLSQLFIRNFLCRMEDTNKMLCSVCGDPLYPGEGVYSFEDPNNDEKEYIFCSLKCLEEFFGIEEWCVG